MSHVFQQQNIEIIIFYNNTLSLLLSVQLSGYSREMEEDAGYLLFFYCHQTFTRQNFPRIWVWTLIVKFSYVVTAFRHLHWSV